MSGRAETWLDVQLDPQWYGWIEPMTARIGFGLEKGPDVIGTAETGSGKTLAFGLPIFQRLLEEREKVTDHLNEVAKGTNFRVVPIVGGMSTEKQERLLKARPKIVVGTPGRLWELMSGGELHLIEVSANANYRLVYMYKGFMSALHQHSIIIVTLCCVH
ncbi:hypothetical protein TEA_009543 [Camellia sinensis var. sinensis]|uniref:Helicase ATP-binding domain-containing protein n=1 Tax=Camellia sinensis var. sinensis TaxID=542762 RepID=A0A4S4E7A3_CAMSN|nr:hypothetical protein TEA_009543 [Camellia sinensis var. sinensis]